MQHHVAAIDRESLLKYIFSNLKEGELKYFCNVMFPPSIEMVHEGTSMGFHFLMITGIRGQETGSVRKGKFEHIFREQRFRACTFRAKEVRGGNLQRNLREDIHV